MEAADAWDHCGSPGHGGCGCRKGAWLGNFVKTEMRKADELDAWEKGRRQHELLATVWVMERMTEIGMTLRSVLDKLRLQEVDRKGYRPSDENV